MSSDVEEKIFKELTCINERLDSHDKKFEAIDQRFEQVDQRFNQIDQKFEQVDQRFEEIGQTLKEIIHSIDVMKSSIILIEQKVSVEIPTLFDAYSGQHEKQTIHQNEINSLNQKVENHDIRISILEQKSS